MTYDKKGLLVRLVYLCIAILFFFIQKSRRRLRHGHIVLCYHGVNDSQKINFIKQLYLIKNKNTSIGSPAAVDKIGCKSILLCLTFDDAFENLLSNVIPVVTELQIPITIFIPTGSIGTFPDWLRNCTHSDRHQRVMSAEAISGLKQNPLLSFGSHTVDHPRLSLLRKEDILLQLRSSKAAVSKMIGAEVIDLALPHGDYSTTVIEMAFAEGYRNIYTLEPKVNDCDTHGQKQVLGRFSVSPDDWPIEFYLTINGAYAWLAPWRSFCRTLRN